MKVQRSGWLFMSYLSGTHNVQNAAHGAFYSVRGPMLEDEDERDRVRASYCCSLRDYLNGNGPRPAWLDRLERVSEEQAESPDGASVHAWGPFYDADPPKLNWYTREDDEAKSERASLMDRLFLSSRMPENDGKEAR